MAVHGRIFDLYGRRAECELLSERIAQARRGHGGGLVVHGDAGIGKTALLDFAVGMATDVRVVRLAGTESEQGLAYAGLQQLCAPLAEHVKRLPAPQADALGVRLGQQVGHPPSRLLVGLAVLGLLTEAADERPLVCAIDDVHRLDRVSAHALIFAARRLVSSSVLLIFAARQVGPELAGLAELKLDVLRDRDARDLLAATVQWPLDERVRDQIIVETKGNPRALIGLPRTLTPLRFAGGFGLADAAPDNIPVSVQRAMGTFAPRTRLALVAAAADPTGDPTLLWRAMAHLRIADDAIHPAIDAGLLTIESRVVFADSTVRSAAYRSASPRDRQAAHQALADGTEKPADRDRRAWHQAQAVRGPDEVVATELERAASRAEQRGGLAAMAAFLERAAFLTPAAPRRSLRALAAADATLQAGALDATMKMLDMVDPDLPAEYQARADVIRSLALARSQIGDAPALLVDAARRLDQVDAGQARAAYRDAMGAAIKAAGLAGPGGTTTDVARAVRQAPRADPSAARVALLDGVAACLIGRYAAGSAKLRAALVAFSDSSSTTADELRWLPLACTAAFLTWDDEAWDTLARRRVRLARSAGALADLPGALSTLAYLLVLTGELGAAESVVAEAQSVTAAIGSRPLVNASFGIAAVRGRLEPTLQMIKAAANGAAARSEGQEILRSNWAAAVLLNAVGRYEEAFSAAEQAVEHAGSPAMAGWAMAELIEAGARSGQTGRVAQVVEDLSATTTAAGTDWALGVRSRCLALVSDGPTAESLYQTAIDCLARSRARLDLARAQLVYGEWLRRQNRRVEAREQLRLAREMLESMGADAFADRARRELLATGESSRRGGQASGELSAQERQIAVRARDGHTNAAIGNELYLSPRTVEWHLRKVFMKLGVTSRKQLATALGEGQ
jgi:DNA-binding CsgD family transcriptional regulator